MWQKDDEQGLFASGKEESAGQESMHRREHSVCWCRFYRQHNIGYVARPPHTSRPAGFKRRGRFKKASNMNFCLSVAKRVAAVVYTPICSLTAEPCLLGCHLRMHSKIQAPMN